jgi:hypothetical protein
MARAREINKKSTMVLVDLLQLKDVRTAFGDSDIHYDGPDQESPMQGLRQGNGASPAGWIAVSTPLIKMMRIKGFGFKEWMAISQHVVEFVCYSFIDDNDLVIHTSDDREARIRSSQDAKHP